MTPISYELRILFGTMRAKQFTNRHEAEACLRAFAASADLDVSIHPTAYTGASLSTAFPRGGRSLRDAVAVVRPVFES